ncbi:FaeA/PapI family transcriptional regulator [Natronoarchaeum rubrum]|uniref:FaeA/PapI family transcriptional regulator n=1 Tax=Natronoarchaeum rubrum TaxID=755311 RepID=UPI0021135C75|nr:FaeA/PapI family transcriptional regulator [Natronoarchaeum rubrum]
MSDNDDRSWGQFVEEVPDEELLTEFDGAEPRTAAEIADAIATTEYEARSKLDALCRAGELRRKQVRDEPPLTVWFRPRATFAGAESDDRPIDERVDELLKDMEMPGISQMMCDWRRDAVRAAFDRLREEEELEEAEFKRDVYPSHAAGYDDPDSWWETVSDRLGDLPGVVDPRWGGETWRYDGQ